MVRLAAEFDIGLALEPGGTPNNEIAQSNKVFAYLAAGTPVLASDTAGHTELLHQAGGCGWTYPRGNVRALADVIGRLAGDSDTVRRAGQQAT